MVATLFILGLLDFIIGVLFGNIGHIFSLLCFPLVAVIRGYVGINTGTHNYKNAVYQVVTGAGIFFIGLMIGILMFSFRFSQGPDEVQLSATSIGQALTLSIATSFGYFLIYILFGMLSAYICRESHHAKARNGDKDI